MRYLDLRRGSAFAKDAIDESQTRWQKRLAGTPAARRDELPRACCPPRQHELASARCVALVPRGVGQQVPQELGGIVGHHERFADQSRVVAGFGDRSHGCAAGHADA